jgi:hypothetical protein
MRHPKASFRLAKIPNIIPKVIHHFSQIVNNFVAVGDHICLPPLASTPAAVIPTPDFSP